MKKSNMKLLLAGLAGAFVVSACAGGMLISASAENTDPVNSLALEYGASVRYVVGDTSKTGIRFSLKMKDSDYLAMTGEGSAYSDVTFGVLIAPEYYHDIYAFNYDNVFGANAKYYLNDAEEEGKEKIYNLTGSLAEMETGEAGYVYFNASLIDILGVDDTDAANNIALDFRGVGYVKYMLNSETVYKFVDDDGVLREENEYDNDNVRSMATVAEAAIEANTAEIAKLDKEGKTEDDQATINFLTTQNTTLQASYLNQVNYTLASRTYSETIDPLTTTTITVPTSVWALKDTYLAKKYSLAWTFAGSEVTAGQVINTPTLSGTYALVATATNNTDDTDTQVVYTKTFTVDAPKVNDNPLSAQGEFTYDVNTGLYDSRSSSLKQFFVDSVTDGDYVVETTITTSFKEGTAINMPGMIIGTGAYDNYIVLKGLGGSGRLYIAVRTSDANGVYTSNECYISGNLSGADKVGGITKYTVARVNGTYYVYSYDGKFCCAIDSTGIHINGDRTIAYESGHSEEKLNERLAEFYKKGKENIVGIYCNAYNANANIGYTYDVKMTKGTQAEYAIGAATVNGKVVSTSGTFIYNEDKNQFGVDSTRSDYATSKNYFLNTITDGDYTIDLNVNVEYREAGKFGHMIGVVIANGSASRITLSYAPWEANKLVVNVRDENNNTQEITVTNFNFTSTTGGVYPFSIARLNNVYYVYNSSGQLGFTISASGLTLQSGFTANKALTDINTKIESVFNTGMQTVIGMTDTKNAATGTYWFDVTMTRGTAAANKKVNPTV